MKDTFSPKQVALAFGVSESSLKRWCDRGWIPTVRTGGGHRRIRLNDIIGFSRQSGHRIVHPAVLDLTAAPGLSIASAAAYAQRLAAGLTRADTAECRAIMFELVLSGTGLADICDLVVAPALRCLGDEWECGRLAIYQERLACELAGRLLDECGGFLPAADALAPTAIGGTPAGDPYALPTRMAELVLREAGWQALSLGSNLPLETIAAAALDRGVRCVWLSCSAPLSVEFGDAVRELRNALLPDVALVVGGRAVEPEVVTRWENVTYCPTMRALSGWAEAAGELAAVPM